MVKVKKWLQSTFLQISTIDEVIINHNQNASVQY